MFQLNTDSFYIFSWTHCSSFQIWKWYLHVLCWMLLVMKIRKITDAFSVTLSRLTSRRRRRRRLAVPSVASSTTGASWTLCPPSERRRDPTPTPKCFYALKEKPSHHGSVFTKLNVILLYRINIGLDKNRTVCVLYPAMKMVPFNIPVDIFRVLWH